MNQLLNQLEGVATLREKTIDLGNVFKKLWMKLEIHAYDYENIGNVSTMKMNTIFNLMSMNSIIITASKRDLPLISIDRMKILNKEILLLELYDTQINQYEYPRLLELSNRFNYLKEYKTEERWYSSVLKKESVHKVGRFQSDDFDLLTSRWLEVLLDYIWDSEECEELLKINKQREYVKQLLSHGGTSTDFFIKMFGKEKTEELFKNYIFGVE